MKGASIIAIAKKEVFHIIRDPFTLALALGMPVVMVLFFGYAIEFNMDRIELAIYDGSQTQTSWNMAKAFTSSGYFISQTVHSPAEAVQALDEGRVHAALVIPRTLAQDLKPFSLSSVQILVDGSDNSSAGSIVGYLGGIQHRILEKEFGKITEPLQVKTRFLFNPELNSRWFVVPGLAAAIVAILSILLTALTVAREWENGSMELLLSTPVRPIEIILGKLLPYSVMGVLAVFFVFVLSQLIFAVPFKGHFLIYLLASLIFLSTYLAQGLLISVITRKQQLSMQFAMLSGLLPTILLSGFIFPNEHMPSFFYYLTMLLPARWFIQISRQLFLQGSGFGDLWPSFVALGILFVLMIFLATKKFKKDVEP
ncbi:MAG: multidrug ABC transporter permease [Bdellovibrio sp. ArHS]|uniref:ABC transporter permease n=1 Tax=Bdellovibrio sp. ArHS TaxID=1569284 RepID=UPI000582C094|nr:ABC transporter permease [Bdellovibrio sp. ArHS]KHD87941.1 MAG: multidrug ABC transporter permease [Bdellovibrio sp. ArHS]